MVECTWTIPHGSARTSQPRSQRTRQAPRASPGWKTRQRPPRRPQSIRLGRRDVSPHAQHHGTLYSPPRRCTMTDPLTRMVSRVLGWLAGSVGMVRDAGQRLTVPGVLPALGRPAVAFSRKAPPPTVSFGKSQIKACPHRRRAWACFNPADGAKAVAPSRHPRGVVDEFWAQAWQGSVCASAVRGTGDGCLAR